jgi:hypothetical protein
MVEDDAALTAFLGAKPEDFQFARERFDAGDYLPMINVALQQRNVSAEQVTRIINDLAAQHIEPLIASQLPRNILVNRLIDRGMTGDEADAVLQSVQDRYDRRLNATGLTQPHRWLDLVLSYFGIFRIPGLRWNKTPFKRK